MVTDSRIHNGRRGAFMIELIVAVALLLGLLLPIAYSFTSEARRTRASYYHAVAMEIVDGEMEVLLAGEWRAFPRGVHPYPVNAEAATNLPDGEFILTVHTNRLRLEWQPAVKQHARAVVREVMVK